MSTADTFAQQLRDWHVKSVRRVKDVFFFSTSRLHSSIVTGDPLTGAPGQPVARVMGGNLRASWVQAYPTAYTFTSTTNVIYAPFIEAGGNSRGQFTLRSEVGGFHSVKLTRAAWDKLVEAAIVQATAGVP